MPDPVMTSAPTGDNPSIASTTRAAEPDRGAQEVSRVEIEPAENGGYTAKCYKRPSAPGDGGSRSYSEPKSYAFADFQGLDGWLATELGAEAPASAPAAVPEPSAAPAGPPAMPPGMAQGVVSRG